MPANIKALGKAQLKLLHIRHRKGGVQPHRNQFIGILKRALCLAFPEKSVNQPLQHVGRLKFFDAQHLPAKRIFFDAISLALGNVGAGSVKRLQKGFQLPALGIVLGVDNEISFHFKF